MKSNVRRMLKAVFIYNYLVVYLAGYPAAFPAFLITRYPAAVSGIQPDTGYKKRPDYPAGYPGASLLKGYHFFTRQRHRVF